MEELRLRPYIEYLTRTFAMLELQTIDGIKGYVLDEIRLPDECKASLKALDGEGDRNAERRVKMLLYFGGMDVLKMDTPRGPFIVGSGPPEEVAQILVGLSKEQRKRIVLLLPGVFRFVNFD